MASVETFRRVYDLLKSEPRLLYADEVFLKLNSSDIFFICRNACQSPKVSAFVAEGLLSANMGVMGYSSDSYSASDSDSG